MTADKAYLYNQVDRLRASGSPNPRRGMNNSETYTGIDDLTVSLSDGVLSVTLNRPDSLNSLTAPMLETIGTTLERAATDPG